jgi:hydrogenase maturation factor
VSDTPNFPFQRPVRALLTLPNYDHSGNAWFFTVLAGFNVNAFTSDAAGQRARQIADRSPEYVFPRTGTDPLGLGALRQSVMLDMRNGYFSNNKLGLWIHVWVGYTAKALNTAEGRKMMNDLAQRNGRDLDGTAIIASVSEIDNLFSKGFITKKSRPLSDPLRYAVCPVIKDPRDGGIAKDQFLAITRKPDGTALEPAFLENFNSLQTTGEPAD